MAGPTILVTGRASQTFLGAFVGIVNLGVLVWFSHLVDEYNQIIGLPVLICELSTSQYHDPLVDKEVEFYNLKNLGKGVSHQHPSFDCAVRAYKLGSCCALLFMYCE
jgi:hypothetical protein